MRILLLPLYLMLLTVMGGCDAITADKELREGLSDCYDLTDEECTAIRSADDDRDGVVAEDDCNDDDARVYPGATEVCDEIDNDCDEIVDEDAVDASIWYVDVDADGYGVDADENKNACDQPDGYAGVAGDCDDGNPAYNPGAAEDNCEDPADYNCDGSTGNADGDDDDVSACEGDCNDGDGAVHPGATEIVGDEVDQDCDGDETCHTDVDGDGYRTDAEVVSSDVDCDDDGEAASSIAGEDCDDVDHTINPGATETWYDGIDGNCDGENDYDQDGDGFEVCAEDEDGDPVLTGGCDCLDEAVGAYPGAAESCDNTLDDDCDGDANDGCVDG